MIIDVEDWTCAPLLFITAFSPDFPQCGKIQYIYILYIAFYFFFYTFCHWSCILYRFSTQILNVEYRLEQIRWTCEQLNPGHLKLLLGYGIYTIAVYL